MSSHTSPRPVPTSLFEVVSEIERRLDARPEEGLQPLRLSLEELAHFLAAEPTAEPGDATRRLAGALERLRGRWRAADEEIHRLADETDAFLADLRRADAAERQAFVEAYQRDVGALD